VCTTFTADESAALMLCSSELSSIIRSRNLSRFSGFGAFWKRSDQGPSCNPMRTSSKIGSRIWSTNNSTGPPGLICNGEFVQPRVFWLPRRC
jgi:hypothetical protein